MVVIAITGGDYDDEDDDNEYSDDEGEDGDDDRVATTIRMTIG